MRRIRGTRRGLLCAWVYIRVLRLRATRAGWDRSGLLGVGCFSCSSVGRASGSTGEPRGRTMKGSRAGTCLVVASTGGLHAKTGTSGGWGSREPEGEGRRVPQPCPPLTYQVFLFGTEPPGGCLPGGLLLTLVTIARQSSSFAFIMVCGGMGSAARQVRLSLQPSPSGAGTTAFAAFSSPSSGPNPPLPRGPPSRPGFRGSLKSGIVYCRGKRHSRVSGSLDSRFQYRF